jgi:hypothetical protein
VDQVDQVDPAEKQTAKTFMLMGLLPNVTRANVIMMFLISVVQALILTVRTSCYALLLQSDYHKGEHDSAEVTARLALITDFFLIPSELILGGLMDKYGRKWFTIASCFC